MLSFPVYLYIYIYIYWYQSDTHGIVVAPRPFNGMMRQTVWPVCGFADRQRRPWSQSDWLGVRTRRAQGPPEVAHHRPTFSTSGLALSLGPPRPLSLSLPARISNVSFSGLRRYRWQDTRGRGNYQVMEQPDDDSFRGTKAATCTNSS